MLRWALYILAGPVLILVGLSKGVADHPAPDMPSAPISVGQVARPTPAPAVAAPRPPSPPRPTAAVAVADQGASDELEAMIQYARSWLSPPVPYLWGGCSHHGIDCSCFVQTVYAQFGVHVSRTTVTQVAEELVVPRDQIQPGDSVFFDNTCINCGANPTHVGIYIGGGLMIDAGDPVQIEPVFWNKLHSIGRPRGL